CAGGIGYSLSDYW
nr:immunoglobulin heavy chain junction region [Macaca mulatta]